MLLSDRVHKSSGQVTSTSMSVCDGPSAQSHRAAGHGSYKKLHTMIYIYFDIYFDSLRTRPSRGRGGSHENIYITSTLYELVRTVPRLLVPRDSGRECFNQKFTLCFYVTCNKKVRNLIVTWKKEWSCGVSIPVPHACEASALPSELQPLNPHSLEWSNSFASSI
jgi:hypothetical protein